MDRNAVPRRFDQTAGGEQIPDTAVELDAEAASRLRAVVKAKGC